MVQQAAAAGSRLAVGDRSRVQIDCDDSFLSFKFKLIEQPAEAKNITGIK